MTILIAILASIAAFGGGWMALRFRDRLHLILGLSAGAVLGAALFDLIPEAIELGDGYFEVGHITALVALGFLTYLVLDRVFSFHGHTEGLASLEESVSESDPNSVEHRPHKGTLGAASFCLHSIIDGIAIGTAFQASSVIGTVVAIAVIAHRFSDGINTVGVILKHKGENRLAFSWLTLVAVSPILGAISTYFFAITEKTLAVLLAVFAGFFLYIGGSDLIPEGHHSHSRILTTIMTLVGASVLYIIVQIA